MLNLFLALLMTVADGPTGMGPDETACQSEIIKIEKEIRSLSEERATHARLATFYQTKGDRWQYETGNIQDAYANWARANQELQAMISIQKQIDALNAKKERIINIYPLLGPP